MLINKLLGSKPDMIKSPENKKKYEKIQPANSLHGTKTNSFPASFLYRTDIFVAFSAFGHYQKAYNIFQIKIVFISYAHKNKTITTTK